MKYLDAIVGIARTRAQAIECARRVAPEIVITDLSLADGSSGLDALIGFGDLVTKHVVVILTGSPQLALSGREGEPTFILEKPHTEAQLLLMCALAVRERS